MARILIADDDEATLVLLKTAVGEWHHQTMQVRDAGAVAPTVRSYKPDLLLLDYQFPSASGAQVLQMVRTLAEGVQLPVILLSGSPLELVRFNVEESPLVRFMTKPPKLDVLKATITELLSSGPNAGDAGGFEILK